VEQIPCPGLNRLYWVIEFSPVDPYNEAAPYVGRGYIDYYDSLEEAAEALHKMDKLPHVVYNLALLGV